jgi:hypothetical protein
MRDGYSNFKFFQCFEPQDLIEGARRTGVAIDIKGYETATILVNIGDNTGGGAFTAQWWQALLEHYNSTAGAWSECYPSQMIGCSVGEAGTFSVLYSGMWFSFGSADQSAVIAVGYKGPHRTIRVAFSDVNAASTMSIGAVAVLGLPANWPINTPAGD